MRKALVLALTAAALAAPSFVIVPGKSVGPLTAQTKRADVERLLQLKPEEVADGTTGDQESTEAWPLDKSRRLSLLWKGEKLDAVLLSGESSRWKTAEGVTLGTSLATLSKLNGDEPLKIKSFEGEQAGQVIGWRQPALVLTLTWRAAGYNKLSGAQKEALEQPGRIFSAREGLMLQLNPVVATLKVKFKG